MLYNYLPLVKSSKIIRAAFLALLYLQQKENIFLIACTNKGEKITSETHLTLNSYHFHPFGNMRPHSTWPSLTSTLASTVATY